tara:strand:+ start:3625 stop:3786 length:162 start_codon:yes stop_codon:yes gene_type:complete
MEAKQVWQMYGLTALIIVLLQMAGMIKGKSIGLVWTAYGFAAVFISVYLHSGL